MVHHAAWGGVITPLSMQAAASLRMLPAATPPPCHLSRLVLRRRSCRGLACSHIRSKTPGVAACVRQAVGPWACHVTLSKQGRKCVYGCQLAPQVFRRMRDKGLPMVVDADGLYIVTKHLELVKGYDKAILTPNKNEYARLASQLGIDLEQVPPLACLPPVEIPPVSAFRHCCSCASSLTRGAVFCVQEGAMWAGPA